MPLTNPPAGTPLRKARTAMALARYVCTRRISSTPQAASARAAEKRRCGLPPGGLRGAPSNSHKASRMSSMLTGAFSPSGARSAGQEAIAEASDAHDARIARFSASVRDGCATTSLGCSKTVPGAGALANRRRCRWRSSSACFPPFKRRVARRPEGPSRRDLYRSGHLGFQLVQVVGRGAVDRDLPRLHGLGDLPDQFDFEQTVVERRALDLDIVGQVELPLEGAGSLPRKSVRSQDRLGLRPRSQPSAAWSRRCSRPVSDYRSGPREPSRRLLLEAFW
jgi:hypothetical protein